MRFRHTVLLTTLVIAPVCTKREKVSDERGIVDSMLSAAGGVDCGGSSLRSSGGGGGRAGGGGRGCDIIRGRAEKKKDTVVVGRRGGNGDHTVNDVHTSGTGDDGSVIYSRQLPRGGTSVHSIHWRP